MSQSPAGSESDTIAEYIDEFLSRSGLLVSAIVSAENTKRRMIERTVIERLR
jgi:hypothetical protein